MIRRWENLVKYASAKESEVSNVGGLIYDENGKVIGHVTSPDRLTEKSIEFWETEIGMELRCAICGSRLQPGDQKDHLWPYFTKHNRCVKCLEEEKT